MKRSLSAVLIFTAICTTFFSGCGATSSESVADANPSNAVQSEQVGEANAPYTIGFLNTLISSKWRAQLMEDAEVGAEQLKAAGKLDELIIQTCQNDVSTQLNQMNQMINQGVDCILLDPASTTALGTAVQDAIDAGILVLLVQDAAPYPGTYVISDNNELMATALSTWVAQSIGGEGGIVELTGIPGHSDDTVRVNKMHEALEQNFPGVEILASAPCHYNYSEAESIISQNIATFGDRIKAVISQDDMAPGTLLAFQNANAEFVPMVGHTTKSFLEDWKELGLDCIAYSIYTGKIVDAMNIAVRLLDGEEINPEVLTPNSFDETLINQIRLEAPYIVTTEAMPDAPWMEGLTVTKSIGVDEAIQLCEGKEGDWALDRFLTSEELDRLFLK
jgi:ABC-type sugar transport system substrate-binding protein